MTAVRANTAFCNGNSRRRGRGRDRGRGRGRGRVRRQRQPPPSFPFRAASSCKKMQRQLSKHHQHKDGTMATVAAQDEGAGRERRAGTVCTAHDGYCAAAAALQLLLEGRMPRRVVASNISQAVGQTARSAGKRTLPLPAALISVCPVRSLRRAAGCRWHRLLPPGAATARPNPNAI